MGRKQIKMEKLRELLRLYYQSKMSIRKASESVGISKTTACEYIREFRKIKLNYCDIVKLSDSELFELIDKSQKASNVRYQKFSENFEYIEKELKRPGVTLQLLWKEFKLKDDDIFSYSRFCYYFSNWCKKQSVNMHIEHKAGDKMFVDFAGKKLRIFDNTTDEFVNLEVFVAILPASQYTYVEVCLNQQKDTWVELNENALRYFGGVPKAIVPDNLKSGVTHACNYEPEINRTYLDFAQYYETAILPARAAKPKDKALVEGAVKIIYQRIYAPLRDTVFYEIEDLNLAILDLLDKHNNLEFQQRKTSRYKLFMEIEKPELKALPIYKYELMYFKVLKVLFNYHVYLKEDNRYYSTPYQYAGTRVTVKYSLKLIEIYKNNIRIAFHKRNICGWGYSTKKEHMPSNHRFVSDWSPPRFINWASKFGDFVKEFIIKLLESRQHPEQAFKACLGVLNLAKKHDSQIMQIVCNKAIELNCISYKFIENSLKNKTYNITDNTDNEEPQLQHENIRGKKCFK